MSRTPVLVPVCASALDTCERRLLIRWLSLSSKLVRESISDRTVSIVVLNQSQCYVSNA